MTKFSLFWEHKMFSKHVFDQTKILQSSVVVVVVVAAVVVVNIDNFEAD